MQPSATVVTDDAVGPTPFVRLGVIDDHPVVGNGIAHQLIESRDIVLVGYAANAAQAGPMCARTRPDVVLPDVRLPDASAATLVGAVHRAWKQHVYLTLVVEHEVGHLSRAHSALASCADGLTRARTPPGRGLSSNQSYP